MPGARTADLPLHYGKVPQWLAERMSLLGTAIVESVILEYGKQEVLSRLSNPFWFQSLGAVMGMDWHSSGITTSVMGALKRGLQPKSHELGIYICGGRGKHSLQTPTEIRKIAERTGLEGEQLVRHSRLAAKVDNTAVQDGFQLYLHSFILTTEGDWAVVQQGMNGAAGMARRYHWNSQQLSSFLEQPHTAVCGENQGLILNLTAAEAQPTKRAMVQLTGENPDRLLAEFRRLQMPRHHDVRKDDVDLKRLGALLALTSTQEIVDFENLLLQEGLGPRTLQSLALVSEVIHGTPTRFSDPARFSFAHGGKDGHPFPVPLKVYDETLSTLQKGIERSKLGFNDKREALKKLHELSVKAEASFTPNDNLDALIQKERAESWKYGGMTVMGKAKRPSGHQLDLFNDPA